MTEVELGPLTEPATLTLAQHVSGQAFDPTLAPMLYQGTEGYPLFVVEMVRAGLGQMGQRTSNHAREMIRSAHELPAKVQQVIQARLAQLSPSAQDLVGLAAVIGRAFTFDVISHASNADEETLVRGLDELWQRRIIREQGADAYDFSHDKIREVAYTGQSSARRRLLHRKVAAALEAVHARNLDAVSGQIAAHYEQASESASAANWYVRACRQARDANAPKVSITFYRKALALLPDTLSPQRLQLHNELGEMLRRQAHFVEAAQTFMGGASPEQSQ